MPSILLFDIDGTLIRSGGAGARALERAMEEALGLEKVRAGFSFGGMTDRAIFRRMLGELGIEPSEEAIGAILAIYPDILRQEVARAEAYAVAPGMHEALEALADAADPERAVGLGTGNIEVGARIKLERGGLNHHFAFGGFGCDAEDRAELLAAGAARGAARLGAPLEECSVLVIGDTPRDVAAAHAIGATCLAVATGGATREALAEAGADHLFDDMTAPGAREVLFEA